MKYLMIIYDKPGTRELFSSPEGREMMDESMALMDELTKSGELLSTNGLADPSNTKTIRLQGGVPVVTDGPLAEAKEHFGGYLLLDCESIERATEIATRWPSARISPVEIRPLMEDAGMEM